MWCNKKKPGIIRQELGGHDMNTGNLRLDEIGFWSEIKLEILKEYSAAYSKILSNQRKQGRKIDHFYIDAFAGAGVHLSKTTKEPIPGSPVNALLVDPPFTGYFFIDLDGVKVELLREIVGEHKNVQIFQGDCNEHLLKSVFPLIRYDRYQRALCLLDPYGLHLKWEVLYAAGHDKAFEMLLNFPVADMNRNVLWKDAGAVDPQQSARMDAFWGDDTWKKVAYDSEGDLFGMLEKQGNEHVVSGFRKRLRNVGGFDFVAEPLPMKNTKGAIVYYLFFASHNKTGNKIAVDIFNKYRKIMGV